MTNFTTDITLLTIDHCHCKQETCHSNDGDHLHGEGGDAVVERRIKKI